MPLDPGPEDDDSQPWWQIGPPLRVTVHPASPPNPQAYSSTAFREMESDGYPNDWIEPDGYPDDWITPANEHPASPGINNWIAPAQNVASGSVPYGAIESDGYPNDWIEPDGYPDDWIAPANARPGSQGIRIGPATAAVGGSVPYGSIESDGYPNDWIAPAPSTERTEPGLSTQPAAALTSISNRFAAPPVPYAGSANLQAAPSRPPIPAVGLLGEAATPIHNANRLLPPSPGATSLAATAANSLDRGGRPPTGSAAASNSNPLSRILNALNPISPAFAGEESWGFPPIIAQALAQGLIDAATAKILSERANALQHAQDAWNDLREVAQGRPSSLALGAALEASGISRPKGYAAHHIAAGKETRAEFARIVLRKFGIGINSAANGVFLPANRATQIIAGKTIHSTLHTIEYYDAVNDALEMAKTREEAIDTLRRIGQALQSGTFP